MKEQSHPQQAVCKGLVWRLGLFQDHGQGHRMISSVPVAGETEQVGGQDQPVASAPGKES